MARSFHEPEESERMLDANDALDEIERCVRTVIDAGGEYALRQRLAHLLPPAECAQRLSARRLSGQRSKAAMRAAQRAVGRA